MLACYQVVVVACESFLAQNTDEYIALFLYFQYFLLHK